MTRSRARTRWSPASWPSSRPSSTTTTNYGSTSGTSRLIFQVHCTDIFLNIIVQVKRVIGRGNFGEVKLAKERSSGAVYALKVMKKVGEMSSAYFSEERDIMARYGHWI